MSFFEEIQNALPKMSDAKKNVAHYLLDNWLEVVFISASKVAKKAKVSESVVVRFSQDLGYSGFPELQEALQEILKSRLVSTTSLNDVSENEFYQNQDDNYKKVFDMSTKNLHDALNYNEVSCLNSFVDKIIKAKRVLIIARKNSMGPAYLLNVHINEIYSKSQVCTGESLETLDVIKGMTTEDLIITIAIPKYSNRMAMLSDYATEKGIPQLSITNSHSNTFSKNAEVTLLTVVNSASFSNSHLTTIFLIDVILYFITLREKGEVLKSLEELNVLSERFGVYE